MREPLLHGIDLHVGTGEAVAVLGAAGAGKTVLARALSGLDPIRSGRLLLDGRDLAGADTAALVRAGLIHVPQAGPEGGPAFGNLSARDNLLLGATLRARPLRTETLARVLELLPALRPVLDHRADRLPVDVRQALAIGRGLMAQPRLLLLDAPGPALTGALVGHLLDHGIGILLLDRPARFAPPGPAVNRTYRLHGGRILEGCPA